MKTNICLTRTENIYSTTLFTRNVYYYFTMNEFSKKHVNDRTWLVSKTEVNILQTKRKYRT